ncbi:hypothetical protein AB0L00_10260 [Actinoallomurus sp. NPDC052308]|uniref:hypothetical protein n=1 Tax=Actinoallomurus sp. NPDC052308 TaxID=3155530 RepID=UPI003433F7F7
MKFVVVPKVPGHNRTDVKLGGEDLVGLNHTRTGTPSSVVGLQDSTRPGYDVEGTVIVEVVDRRPRG